MVLIQKLHEKFALPPKEARAVVDAFYTARDIGIRQPTIIQAISFGMVASRVLVVPMLLVYWLWLQFRPR